MLDPRRNPDLVLDLVSLSLSLTLSVTLSLPPSLTPSEPQNRQEGSANSNDFTVP